MSIQDSRPLLVRGEAADIISLQTTTTADAGQQQIGKLLTSSAAREHGTGNSSAGPQQISTKEMTSMPHLA
jgi:hypothetical protein